MKPQLSIIGSQIKHEVVIKNVDNDLAAEKACRAELDEHLTTTGYKLLPIHVLLGQSVRAEVQLVRVS